MNYREFGMKFREETDAENQKKLIDAFETLLSSQFESLHMLNDDVCIFFDETVGEFILINQSKMHSLMRTWRDMLKLGQISILRENCVAQPIKGVEYFLLVLQSPSSRVPPETIVFDNQILVAGKLLIFKNQKKRDDVFNWLEKFCQVKADEAFNQAKFESECNECLICMDKKTAYVTKCCKQPLCQHCLNKKKSLCCPFCRKEY
jgi:hypothetical protein